jgi:hypothetical protein
MIRCTPLEQQFVGFNVDFLEEAVPNVVRVFLPFFKVAECTQIVRVNLIDGE